jgi:hypothetical protein
MPIWIPQLHGTVTYQSVEYAVRIGWPDRPIHWFSPRYANEQWCGGKLCGKATVDGEFVAYSYVKENALGPGDYTWLINVGPTINEWFAYESWREAAIDLVRLYLGEVESVRRMVQAAS